MKGAREGLPTPLWQPPPGRVTAMDIYRKHVNEKFGQNLSDSQALHKWTVDYAQEFWIDLYEYLHIVPPLPSGITQAYDPSLPMNKVPLFFDGLQMNYAENILSGRDPNRIALIGLRESGDGPAEYESLTWAQLEDKVRLTASALRAHGIRKGERVAALISTSPWAVVLLLASASIGAIYTSIATDMGAEGVMSRLTQVSPAILFADSDTTYKGKRQSIDSKLDTVMKKLPSSTKLFVIPTSERTFPYPTITDFLHLASPHAPLEYVPVPFSHPLYILYSSGTSGPPKCLVHQHGVILQMKKIAQLHNSLTSSSVVMQYSSTSWVLFNVMNGHMSVGATVICYDGSPFFPDVTALLRIVEKYRVTYLGVSPRWILQLETSGVMSKYHPDVKSLSLVTTTGAPLSPDQFRWWYRTFPKVHLSLIAGGTDIASSWIATDPSGLVYAGEMQMKALGMAVDVLDEESGESIESTGKPGEMVITKPFPSMPIYFWKDEGNKKYMESYFTRFDHPIVWAQHDIMRINPITKGCVIQGRSDGVLNPSGVRFGSAEIYAISEGPLFNQQIDETLCIGRKRPQDKDEEVFLFVKMRRDSKFTPDLVRRLRDAIRTGLSPRHVPAFIVEVAEIPVTINGKKVEIPVKSTISGRPVKVSSTVANPQCLENYKQFVDLERKVVSRL